MIVAPTAPQISDTETIAPKGPRPPAVPTNAVAAQVNAIRARQSFDRVNELLDDPTEPSTDDAQGSDTNSAATEPIPADWGAARWLAYRKFVAWSLSVVTGVIVTVAVTVQLLSDSSDVDIAPLSADPKLAEVVGAGKTRLTDHPLRSESSSCALLILRPNMRASGQASQSMDIAAGSSKTKAPSRGTDVGQRQAWPKAPRRVISRVASRSRLSCRATRPVGSARHRHKRRGNRPRRCRQQE